MKLIRKFEELDPQVYRNAAYRFDTFNKVKKANKLKDWADYRQYGLYNMHFANTSGKIVTSSFTMPKLLGIYYDKYEPGFNFSRADLLNKDVDIDDAAQWAVKRWMNGNQNLSIKFEFGLKPTNECIEKSSKHSYLIDPYKNTGRYLGHAVPMFTIEYQLSEWVSGVEEFDEETQWHCEREGTEFKPSTAAEMYECTQYSEFFIQRPYNEHYFGIFADRQSAKQFLKFFSETMKSDPVKRSIMELLSSVGTDYQLDKTLEGYTRVRYHGLYDDDIRASNNLQSVWFKRNIN